MKRREEKDYFHSCEQHLSYNLSRKQNARGVEKLMWIDQVDHPVPEGPVHVAVDVRSAGCEEWALFHR